MNRRTFRTSILAVAAALAASPAQAQVKIAFIDPLSGFMAAAGDHCFRELKYAAERMNAAGGILGQPIEIIGWDNKLSPQETQVLVGRAVEQGIHFIVQGNGSSAGSVILDAVNKNNERNPDKRLLYLNYAAIDPDFTNGKCSYWHFRFDAESDQKLQPLVAYMAAQKDVKKVYLINQDYQFGHQVSKSAKELIHKMIPGAQIVGDELHALAKVKDFTPYITKIQASGADAVLTGNWGSDFALLVKAAKDAGLKARFYGFYAGVAGAATALGEAALERVYNSSYEDENIISPEGARYIEGFKKKYGKDQDPYTYALPIMLDMLKQAATKANSLDPAKIAAAMEGLTTTNFFGPVEMRKDNHQLIQNMYVTTFAKVDGKTVRFNADGAPEFGFRSTFSLPAEASRLPTTCQMNRPSM